MKALTVMQPWASLIMLGAKRFETRSWKTNFLGTLLIHASKKLAPAALALCFQEPFKSALAPLLHPYQPPHTDEPFYYDCPWDLPLGFLLGTVQVSVCRTAEDVHADLLVSAEEKAFGDYRPGRWAWELCEPRLFETPIPYKGRQGLWDVPYSHVEKALCDARTGGESSGS